MIRKNPWRSRSFFLGVGIAISLVVPAAGQPAPVPAPKTKGLAHVEVAGAAASPADVSTIDGMVKAYYDVISGPPGQPREWSRDRTLYVPDVRFVMIGENKDGSLSAVSMTHQEYVDYSDPSFVKDGFDEKEIYRVTEQFGSIANVFSTYESRRTPAGAITARGINSLQLFHDGKRWWIASATWQDESSKHPIPKKYLPRPKKP